MTVVAMHKRIRKLESAVPGGLGALTYDELCVRILELARECPPEADTEEAVRGIEQDIIRLAAKQASPEYAKHLEWCRAMWRKRTGEDTYQPALTGSDGGFGEYQDWDKPNVMERRLALRDSRTVQELLARMSC